MIIACIIAILLLTGIGTFFNYLGVECVRGAFELAGGSAIGVFFLGLVLVTVSVVAFCALAMLGKALIEEIKYNMKWR